MFPLHIEHNFNSSHVEDKSQCENVCLGYMLIVWSIQQEGFQTSTVLKFKFTREIATFFYLKKAATNYRCVLLR